MSKNKFFIDSCIFLGTIIKDENTRACKSFISWIQNDVFMGYISSFVTGEMINSILYADNIKPMIKSEILHIIVDMIISTKLENFVPLNNDLKVYSQLRKADPRISDNEESTIGDVIKATSRFLDEILVISDGSTDSTTDVAKSAGATVIDNIVNRGLGMTIKLSYKEGISQDWSPCRDSIINAN